MALDRLPEQLLLHIADMVLGQDILALTQSSPQFEALLSNPSLWTKRTNLRLHVLSDRRRADDNATSGMQHYRETRSLLFRANDRRGSAIQVPFPGRYAFSFAMWFCLRPSNSGHRGGILVGAQSTSITNMKWPYHHLQFVLVDPRGDLYCSVLSSQKVVKSNLEDNRWYHLALTYDDETETQCVYVDGALVDRRNGTLHHEWFDVEEWQIGSGCISSTAPGKPTPDHCGWYPFQGLIDEYLLWDWAVSPEEVELLVKAKGNDPTIALQFTAPECVVRHPVTRWQYGAIETVQCSRPAERWCEIWSS
ncbi:hypothetical protein PINS_up002705 [Pythium insidiosum]|nr:hypothetical protein PINS_up002705 [Pythium insidiosum]